MRIAYFFTYPAKTLARNYSKLYFLCKKEGLLYVLSQNTRNFAQKNNVCVNECDTHKSP